MSKELLLGLNERGGGEDWSDVPLLGSRTALPNFPLNILQPLMFGVGDYVYVMSGGLNYGYGYAENSNLYRRSITSDAGAWTLVNSNNNYRIETNVASIFIDGLNVFIVNYRTIRYFDTSTNEIVLQTSPYPTTNTAFLFLKNTIYAFTRTIAAQIKVKGLYDSEWIDTGVTLPNTAILGNIGIVDDEIYYIEGGISYHVNSDTFEVTELPSPIRLVTGKGFNETPTAVYTAYTLTGNTSYNYLGERFKHKDFSRNGNFSPLLRGSIGYCIHNKRFYYVDGQSGTHPNVVFTNISGVYNLNIP
ncbi:MAG: hypothetical protein M0R77_01015 [Gammaproteobacteria bacterium]|nr:hypothetical protein [Acholeplasmataceae bacterium]MCK9529136.1 hypothetical protein [Gammaproteobacteria bacterium]